MSDTPKLNDHMPAGPLRRALDRSSERKCALANVDPDDDAADREVMLEGVDWLRRWMSGLDMDIDAYMKLSDSATEEALRGVMMALYEGRDARVILRSLLTDMFVTGALYEQERSRG